MTAPYPDHNEFGERLAHDGSIGPTREEAKKDREQANEPATTDGPWPPEKHNDNDDCDTCAWLRSVHVAWMDGDASDE